MQTCRGSHTHTLLVDPKDPNDVYIYISGSSFVRPSAELPGCVNASSDQDPNGSKFRIDVIKVPLAHPEQAAVVQLSAHLRRTDEHRVAQPGAPGPRQCGQCP